MYIHELMKRSKNNIKCSLAAPKYDSSGLIYYDTVTVECVVHTVTTSYSMQNAQNCFHNIIKYCISFTLGQWLWECTCNLVIFATHITSCCSLTNTGTCCTLV